MSKTYSIKTIFEVLDRSARPLRKIGTAFASVAKKVNTVGKNLEKAGKKMDDIGKKMSTRLTLPLVALGTAATKLGFDFNESMANIATLIPGNIKRVGELKKGVQDLSIEMGKSTGDMADGLYQVISAFGDSSDSMDRLKIVAKAATAGMAATGTTLDLLSQITKDYGDTSLAGMTKASDLAFLAVKEGQTSFEALAQSMSMVIPTAAKMKLTQEELFATMAAFTRGAATTPMVVTQLNAVLTALASPTKEMEKRFKELDIKSGSLLLEQKGLAETMQLLTKNGSATNEELIALFGNVRAGRLAMSFAGAGADEYNKKLKAMNDYAGTTSDAFAEITDGINKNGFTWKKFMSLLQVVGQEIGDILGPVLVEVVGHLREWLQMFRGLSPETKKFIIKMLAIVAAIGPLLIIGGKLIGVFGGFLKILPFLAKGLTATTAAGTPLLLLLGKIAAIIGVIVAGVYAFNKASDKLSDLMVKSSKQTGWKKGLGAGLSSALRGVPIFGGALANISEQKAIRKLESGMQGGDKSQVDINLNLQAEAGTSATIDSVKRKGTNKNVNLNNISSFGSIFSTASGVFK